MLFRSLQYSGMPDAQDDGLVPWYAHPMRQQIARTVVCGHWSGHGILFSKDLIMLDAGTVYGGPLCAWNLDSKRLIAIPSKISNLL